MILITLIIQAAQGGIAMLSLTYGFEVHTSAMLLTGKTVSIPDMRHFWPQGDNTDPKLEHEEFMAHLYVLPDSHTKI